MLQEGDAAGTIVGGNLCTLNLLQGTPFMPPLEGTVVFAEDDAQVRPWDFDRDLVSLCQQPAFGGVAGLVIGRFQKATGMTRELLAQIVAGKPELAGLPDRHLRSHSPLRAHALQVASDKASLLDA